MHRSLGVNGGDKSEAKTITATTTTTPTSDNGTEETMATTAKQ